MQQNKDMGKNAEEIQRFFIGLRYGINTENGVGREEEPERAEMREKRNTAFVDRRNSRQTEKGAAGE